MSDVSYEGEIITPVKIETSAKGKMHCDFALKTKKQLIECVCWTHMLQDSCPLDKLKQGLKVTIRGFWGGNDNGTQLQKAKKQFVVKWFQIAGEATIISETEREKIVRLAGGEKAYREGLQMTRERRSREGRVLAWIAPNLTAEHDKARCVKWKGQWMYHIHYLQEAMGPETVNRLFWDYVKGKGKVKYKVFVNQLLNTAYEGAPVEVPCEI